MDEIISGERGQKPGMGKEKKAPPLHVAFLDKSHHTRSMIYGTVHVSFSGILVGDTTGNGLVNASDIGQTKSKSGQTANASNFRTDVTVSGSINASDIALVKSKSGTALP